MELPLSVALLVCLYVQLGSAEDYHPDRTLLIDVYPQVNPTNFLFRGNMPVINGSFAYNEIVATMKSVAGKHNYTLPTNFTLMDVSYLNIFEERDLAIERRFFEAHPELGKFDNTVIVGTILPPPQKYPDFIKDVVKEYIELSIDKLPDVMTYLHELLLQPTPTVIYSHCERAIEGSIVPGAKCLIVEDVVSSGGSILETVAALREEGLVVDLVVIFLDREQGGERNLRERGITAISVFTITELMDTLFEAGKVTSSTVEEVQKYISTNKDPVPLSLPPSLTPSPKPHTSYSQRVSSASHPLSARLLTLMDDKRTSLAFSADVQTSKRLLELADAVGPHICLLKTHVDIMTDFSADTANTLKQLATHHNFIIMEDRKFADIGNTVQLQYTSPTLHLSLGWAELVTSHALPGPGVIDGLKSVASAGSGGVLVIEMSTQNALTSPDYVKAAVAMAIAHPQFVVGVVSRHRPTSLPPDMLVMTPGVKLIEGADSFGQQYITPEKAIQELGSDIIIVGRGIYSSSNVVETTKLFQERAYSSYLERIKTL